MTAGSHGHGFKHTGTEERESARQRPAESKKPKESDLGAT